MSEVDKGEIIDGIFIIASYIITIYVAYRMASRDGKGNKLRIILNWFSILLGAEIISLLIIVPLLGILLDKFLPSAFLSYLVGFVWCYYLYSLLFIPFFIILWIYNIIIYIKKKEDAI